MKHYININNEIFAYNSEEEMLKFSSVPLKAITEEQLAELLAPTPEQLVEQSKAEAKAYLSSTDWYVTRMSETGVAIPADILEARAKARELL
jgi:hypothetical protein